MSQRFSRIPITSILNEFALFEAQAEIEMMPSCLLQDTTSECHRKYCQAETFKQKLQPIADKSIYVRIAAIINQGFCGIR